MVLITCNNLVKSIGYSLTFGQLVTKGTHYNCTHCLAKKNVKVLKILLSRMEIAHQLIKKDNLWFIRLLWRSNYHMLMS